MINRMKENAISVSFTLSKTFSLLERYFEPHPKSFRVVGKRERNSCDTVILNLNRLAFRRATKPQVSSLETTPRLRETKRNLLRMKRPR